MTTTAFPSTPPVAPPPRPPAAAETEAPAIEPAATGDPRWVRPALIALLGATALLYLWGLGASGWANSFYSAAAQAGSQSWKALFFGSSDAASSITVDKTPASLWVMGISARLFGVNAWSILVPQALMGVATVGVLYATVRRWFHPGAALIAGAVAALTPVATLMFRFNNPDALLVLLLTCSAYALVRALEAARTRWVVIAFGLIGFAFLAKMLQAFLVVPAFALVYLLAAPTAFRRRVVQLLLGGLTMLVSGGWWVAIVALWPASSRPYIGGSQNNSILDLLFGYNGFGRLTGNETGSVGGGFQAGSQWGPTGITRLFNAEYGGQASWLIPAALILLAAVVLHRWNAARTDRTRAAALLWGGWLVVTGLVISLSHGIIHPYYTVALAPAVGALVGIGLSYFWPRRNELSRAVLAIALGATAVWAAVLLHRTPSWLPWLAPVVLVGGLVVAAGLLVTARMRGRIAAGLAAIGIVLALAGPAAYSLSTARTTHSGALPTAGPSGASMLQGGPGGFGRRGGFPGGGAFPGGGGAFPGGTFPGGAALPGGGTSPGAGGGVGGAGGGVGGILDSTTPSDALVAELDAHASAYRWVAAAVSSNQAAGYQLATGDPVMAIGGFNGSDPSPTLEQFQAYVAAGDIHWFIGGGGVGASAMGLGGQSTGSEIASWVAEHYRSVTVDGTTLYDLTQPLS
jgi:4-amino-4-deoxy-L-arabinose transferase-like glycosyltransferase